MQFFKHIMHVSLHIGIFHVIIFMISVWISKLYRHIRPEFIENYEFGGKVLEYHKEKSLIEIRNRLVVGDVMEILIPNKLEGYEFTIETLWDSNTGERVEFVNPGKSGQTILMKLPIQCEDGWILRRKKNK